jgi:hypothetical protein
VGLRAGLTQSSSTAQLHVSDGRGNPPLGTVQRAGCLDAVRTERFHRTIPVAGCYLMWGSIFETQLLQDENGSR